MNAAHGGGLVAGVLLGLVLARSSPDDPRPRPVVELLGVIAWTVLGATAVFTALRVLDAA